MSTSVPDSVWQKIWRFPEYQMGAHLVTLVLADGSKKKNQIVLGGGEVWRGDQERELGFSPSDVVDAIHQPWTESETDKPWWSSGNEEWWKS